LLASVNSLLKGTRAGVLLHAVEMKQGGIFVDVDLSPIRARRTRRCKMPQRFVAVNISNDRWRRLAELHTRNPALAACLAADRLCRDSGLVRSRVAIIRRKAAMGVLA
jgi:hypothetical protein